MAEQNIKKDIVTKLFLIYGVVGLALIAVIAKIIYIQGQDPSEWEDRLMTIKDRAIAPMRGDICATDGRILATSMPSYSVHWDLTVPGLKDTLFNNNVDSLAACVSRLFGDKTKAEYAKEFRTARAQGKAYYSLRNKVTFTQVSALRKFPIFNKGRYKSGLITEQNYTRELPHKSLAARTIGYCNEAADKKTIVGMEGAFDDILTGRAGMKLMERLSTGDWHPVNPYDDENEVEPEDGRDIISTINVNIQDIAEKSLIRQLAKHNAKHGTVIVMEVRTGKIRAIANIDQNSDGKFSESYNYAIGNALEPGSTFKLASLITVLEKTNAEITDSIFVGDGTFDFKDFTIKDDHKSVGYITIKEAFEKSSNVGISKLVYSTFEKNPAEFVDRLYQMHIDKLTDIEIQGEALPYVKYPGDKFWSGVSLAQMSIGYELKLTPLQTLTFYNAVANNGVMMKPHLLEAIRSHGVIEKIKEPEVLNSAICSQETLEKVHILLKAVVENGTAKNIKSNNYQIAGKTGTAQIAKGKSGYKDDNGVSYQASFCGYFPADKPKYSCIVVINSPTKESYYGSSVACPVFKDIADKLYSQDYDLQSNKEFDLSKYKDKNQIPYSKSGDRAVLDRLFSMFNIQVENAQNAQTQFVYTTTGLQSVKLEPFGSRKSVMPDVRGMGLRDAMFLLKRESLDVTVVGRGTVKKQSLTPGTSIKSGTKVIIELG